MTRLITIKDRVINILHIYPETRDCDEDLYSRYIERFYSHLIINDSIRLRDFKKLPSFGSISRARRIIQHDNERLQPTKESVKQARRIKEKNYSHAEVREAVDS